MSLLDGTYEVLREVARDGERTVLDATGPRGTPLRVVWFDLEPEREADFERYRRTLKRLQRSGTTTLHEVTSRPGAHYAVWDRIPDEAPAVRDRGIDRTLEDLGLARSAVDVRRIDGRARIVDVAFGDQAAFAEPPVETALAHDAAQPPAPEPPSGAPGGILRRVGAAFVRAPAWPIALVLLGAAAFVSADVVQRYLEDRVVVVPDVVGSPVVEVADRLRQLELSVRATARPAGEAAGTVLAIEPPPGTTIRPRRSVDLVYAAPETTVASISVPDVQSVASLTAVERAFEAADLRLGRIVRVSAPDPRGRVLAQSPAAGTDAPQGTPVDLLVSLGPSVRTTFLPDLEGLRLDDARVIARIAGLAGEQIAVAGPAPRSEDAPEPSGTSIVVAQTPAPFVPFALDEATLRLIVEPTSAREAAPTLPDVPDVVGLGYEAAAALVAGLDLPVERAEISTDDLPDGVVMQAPPPGDLSADVDRVVLTVNARPVDIPVPDVDVRVRQPSLRFVPWSFAIEPGIGQVTATVWASTLEGDRTLVSRQATQGGRSVSGSWLTTYPGVVTFELELNGAPYGEPLRVLEGREF